MSDAKAIYDELDAATSALQGYQVTNHYAYLKWSAEDRLAFDRGYHRAQERWQRAYTAKRELVEGPSPFSEHERCLNLRMDKEKQLKQTRAFNY